MAKTNKVTVEYKDGTTQEVEYPTKEEIARMNEEARKLADMLVSLFGYSTEKEQS